MIDHLVIVFYLFNHKFTEEFYTIILNSKFYISLLQVNVIIVMVKK